VKQQKKFSNKCDAASGDDSPTVSPPTQLVNMKPVQRMLSQTCFFLS